MIENALWVMICKLQQIKKHYVLPLEATLASHACKTDAHSKHEGGSFCIGPHVPEGITLMNSLQLHPSNLTE